LQCLAVHCGVLQCAAVCCCVLRCLFSVVCCFVYSQQHTAAHVLCVVLLNLCSSVLSACNAGICSIMPRLLCWTIWTTYFDGIFIATNVCIACRKKSGTLYYRTTVLDNMDDKCKLYFHTHVVANTHTHAHAQAHAHTRTHAHAHALLHTDITQHG